MQSTRHFTKTRPQSPMQPAPATGLTTVALPAAPGTPAAVSSVVQSGTFSTSPQPTVAIQTTSESVYATNVQTHWGSTGQGPAAEDSQLDHTHEQAHHDTDNCAAGYHTVHQAYYNHDQRDYDHKLCAHGRPHHDRHDHDHNHDHHHVTPVHATPLPSWSGIFSNLAPMQKTMFTWFLIHTVIGLCLWSTGVSNESLSIVGYSYLVLFDAFGVFNLFLADVVKSSPAFRESNVKRPFGAQRYELVFAMATTVYLLFVTMYNTKEVLEHSLTGHDANMNHDAVKIGFSATLVVCLGVAATFMSSISFRNHDNFMHHLKTQPPSVNGFSYNALNRPRGRGLGGILSNVYSFSIASCGAVVLLFCMFGTSWAFVDKFLAFGESVVMLFLGGPTAVALAKLLLQTTPTLTGTGIEHKLMEIRQDPDVLSIDRIHFWRNTYGKCVGTLQVHVRPEADEQQVLHLAYQKLESLTEVECDQSELTVSIIKQ